MLDPSLQSTLNGLKDVEGVFGSFLLEASGSLLAKDLPAVFHDEVFVETGPRIVRLCEAIEHGGEAIESLALRFADHMLHVRPSRGGFLCVICSSQTNPAALKMAMSLVTRRLSSTTSSPLTLPAKAIPAPRPASPAATKPRMLYRGRPLG